jgi:hypothetical protein
MSGAGSVGRASRGWQAVERAHLPRLVLAGTSTLGLIAAVGIGRHPPAVTHGTNDRNARHWMPGRHHGEQTGRQLQRRSVAGKSTVLLAFGPHRDRDSLNRAADATFNPYS